MLRRTSIASAFILSQSDFRLRSASSGKAMITSSIGAWRPKLRIIVKGARDAQYGHKLNLVTGHSGLILDVVVEAGNPADAKSVCLG